MYDGNNANVRVVNTVVTPRKSPASQTNFSTNNARDSLQLVYSRLQEVMPCRGKNHDSDSCTLSNLMIELPAEL
jgi:hypothetical protein